MCLARVIPAGLRKSGVRYKHHRSEPEEALAPSLRNQGLALLFPFIPTALTL
jgi:hypothetical protein